MRRMGLAGYCLSAVILAGCAGPTTVTKLVEVPGPTKWVLIPAELLAPCRNADTPTTNGELLDSWHRQRQSLESCDAQIAEIAKLK